MTPAALWVAAAVTATAIFSFDLMLPLGVAGGVPYVVLVLLAFCSNRHRHAFIFAGAGSVLTVLGFFLSEPGSTLWIVLTNRALALFVIWISVLPVIRYQRVRTVANLRLEDIKDSILDAVIILDSRANILTANKAAEAMFGYTAEEMTGRSAAFLRPEPERSKHQKAIDEFQRTGRGTFAGCGLHKERGLRKDGAIFPTETQVGELWRNGQRYLFSTTRDVSARKEAEATHRQTQELFEKAFHASPHLASLVRTSDGCIIDANDAWLRALGRTREEAIGATAADLETWEDPARRDELYRIIDTNGSLCDEGAVWQAKDGRLVDVLLSVERLELKEGSVSLLIAHDETARKKVEKALRESEERFTKAFQAAPLMMCILDLKEFRYLYVNDAWHDEVGYRPEEIIGKTSDVFELWADPAQRAEAHRRVKETGSLRAFAAQWRKRDGTIIEVWVQAECLDIDGEPAIMSISRDITEERRAQDALKAAKEEAEYANRSKTEFLANMSHELRTPLNAVIGFAGMIEKELYGPLGSNKYKKSAAYIDESATHLLNLINDLLDVSKIEVGKMNMFEEDLDVGATVEPMLRMIETRATQAKVLIESWGFAGLPRLFADPRMLKQIVLNLVSNAVKFTPRGGSVAVGAEVDRSGALAITVRDTGIGMAKEDIPTALAAFGQIRSGKEPAREGTGLGLPLAKSLIEMHGGDIEIDSRVNVGTTVTVRYPASRVSRSAASTEILRARAS